MNGSNQQNGLQFKKYNHLTAQIIRGSVRKKIYDIKKRGLSAADEILDDIEKYFKKRIGIQSNEAKNHRTIPQNVKKTDDLHGNGNHAIYNERAETLAEGLELIDKLKNKINLKYSLKQINGQAHEPVFVFECVCGDIVAIQEGKTKQQAKSKLFGR